MKLITIFLSLLLITTNAYARYKILYCDNKYDAYSCSNSCKSDGMDYEYKFKIDKSKNIVIESHFFENKLIIFTTNNKFGLLFNFNIIPKFFTNLSFVSLTPSSSNSSKQIV